MRGLRSTIALLVVLVGLGAYIYFVDLSPTAPQTTKEKVFASLEAAKIEEIQVKSEAGDVTTLKKDGTAWQLVSPVTAKASESEVSGHSRARTDRGRPRHRRERRQPRRLRPRARASRSTSKAPAESSPARCSSARRRRPAAMSSPSATTRRRCSWFRRRSTILGVVANRATEVPAIERKLEARQLLATPGASLAPDERSALRRQADGEDVVIQMLHYYAPVWLAGLLGAGIMAAVMSSDSQILALSTMFTEDVFAHYGGRRRFGEQAQVSLGRAFVVAVTLVAFGIALWAPANIFSLATQYGFSGYAALSPMVFAALFWKRSTKWGALAVTLWAAGAVVATALFQAVVPAPPPGQSLAVLSVGGLDLLSRPAPAPRFWALPP